MNYSKSIALSILALMLAGLIACERTVKTTSAGGGSSSQSVFRVRGAIR